MKSGWSAMAPLVVLSGLVAPVVVRAPAVARQAAGVPATLDAALQVCRDSGLSGWELVDHATTLVHQKFLNYSVWHLWEGPRAAYRNGRGYSNQYNLALAQLLTGLGFTVQVVHAARVRPNRNPWWHVGHTWLWVTHAGLTRDVCASDAANRAGHVSFVAQSQVRVARRSSPLVMALAIAPFTVTAVWRSMVTGTPVPDWVYRPFDSAVRPGGAAPRRAAAQTGVHSPP